ncbi:hypothetical protein [Herpetosiphon gulosus]|uniref:Exonuclease SbcC n=1 Tax=Herpetosiphon gulosus TaxID=1973496 RepID=A0ABP9X6T0_9CHLR
MTEAAHLQEQLIIYQQQLNRLDQQIANFGGRRSAPLHLISQHEALAQQIHDLQAQLPTASINPSQQLQHAQSVLATYQQQLQRLELQIAHAGGRQRALLDLLSQHEATTRQINELEATIAQLATP